MVFSITTNKTNIYIGQYCHQINFSCIYYRNGDDCGKIYKIKTNGCGNTALDNTAVSSINVCDNMIYFYAASNTYKESGLCKIKLDGTCKESICHELSQNINTSSNWIFYINPYDKNLLYEVKPDGTMRQSNDGEYYHLDATWM